MKAMSIQLQLSVNLSSRFAVLVKIAINLSGSGCNLVNVCGVSAQVFHQCRVSDWFSWLHFSKSVQSRCLTVSSFSFCFASFYSHLSVENVSFRDCCSLRRRCCTQCTALKLSSLLPCCGCCIMQMLSLCFLCLYNGLLFFVLFVIESLKTVMRNQVPSHLWPVVICHFCVCLGCGSKLCGFALGLFKSAKILLLLRFLSVNFTVSRLLLITAYGLVKSTKHDY